MKNENEPPRPIEWDIRVTFWLEKEQQYEGIKFAHYIPLQTLDRYRCFILSDQQHNSITMHSLS